MRALISDLDLASTLTSADLFEVQQTGFVEVRPSDFSGRR